MNRIRFVVRSLFFFWRVNLAVTLGVVAATAVLTGALLVGDSMRGSLRKISLDGLGEIDEILLTDKFFREELASKVSQDPGFSDDFERASAIIVFPNTTAINTVSKDSKNVANQVTLIGCRTDFWDFGNRKFKAPGFAGRNPLFDQEDSSISTTPVILNDALANDLGISKTNIQSGASTLSLQIPKPQLINADSPIGEKKDQFETIALLEIVDIVPAESLGRFSLHPTQVLPRIIFLPLWKVQEALQQGQSANALVVSSKSSKTGTTVSQSIKLNNILPPNASDLGLIFKDVSLEYEDQGQTRSISRYVSLSSNQLLLNDRVVDVAMNAFADLNPHPVFTYLANEIELKTKPARAKSDPEAIPFSMVSSVDWTQQFQLKSAIDGQPIDELADNEIVINSWSADDYLDTCGILPRPESTGDPDGERVAAYRSLIGSSIVLRYYEPEASHGKLIEKEAEFVLANMRKSANRRNRFVDGVKPFLIRRPPLPMTRT